MKKNNCLFAIPIAAFALLSACASEKIVPDVSETHSISFNIEASSSEETDVDPATKTWIDGPENIPANSTAPNIHWSGADRLYLLQIGADDKYSGKLAEEIIRTENDTKASFRFKLESQPGKFRYWAFSANTQDTGKHPEYWKNVSDDAKSYQMSIFSDQYLSAANTYDPKCDILFSTETIEKSQDELVGQALGMHMERQNAVARIFMKGIPDNCTLESVKFSADQPIVGSRSYNILDKTWTEGVLTKTIAAETGAKYKPYHDGKKVPYYCVHLSLWPSKVTKYTIEARIKDQQGHVSTYFKSVDRSNRTPLTFEAARITEWTVNMLLLNDDTAESVPEFSSDSNKENPALTLFRKIKNGTDNGIDWIDKWRTHDLGYNGVYIHEAMFHQYKEPVKMWIIEVDPQKATFAVGSAYGQMQIPFTKKQIVTEQAIVMKNQGYDVLAAINGDAWGEENSSFKPYGVMIKDGKELRMEASVPTLGNSDVFYVKRDGFVDIVDLDTFLNMDRSDVTCAINGWYRLICFGNDDANAKNPEKGKPFIRNYGTDEFFKRRARTCLGIAENRVYLMIADEIDNSVGLTMNAAARICYSLGCTKAINLDGGGSTTMVKRWKGGFELLNKPSDGKEPSDIKERPVVNSLMVVAK